MSNCVLSLCFPLLSQLSPWPQPSWFSLLPLCPLKMSVSSLQLGKTSPIQPELLASLTLTLPHVFCAFLFILQTAGEEVSMCECLHHRDTDSRMLNMEFHCAGGP